MFVGHGSPMNAIEDNRYRRQWQALGAEFGRTWPRPALIVCVSAHWVTRGWHLTCMSQPPTIHDFSGFPEDLYAQQYPAAGAPEVVASLAAYLSGVDPLMPIGTDDRVWGLDHGAWSVLKPMFPDADVPVTQLSINQLSTMQGHFDFGRLLRPLRERGVLVLASGNIVHNLRLLQQGARDDQAYPWAEDFDQAMAQHISRSRLSELANFRDLGPLAQQAHPSEEHFLPLLYAAGAAHAYESVRFFNEGFQMASISMRSVVWG